MNLNLRAPVEKLKVLTKTEVKKLIKTGNYGIWFNTTKTNKRKALSILKKMGCTWEDEDPLIISDAANNTDIDVMFVNETELCYCDEYTNGKNNKCVGHDCQDCNAKHEQIIISDKRFLEVRG